MMAAGFYFGSANNGTRFPLFALIADYAEIKETENSSISPKSLKIGLFLVGFAGWQLDFRYFAKKADFGEITEICKLVILAIGQSAGL